MAEQGPEQAQLTPTPPTAAPGRKLFSFDNIIVSLIMVVIGFGLGYGACYRQKQVADLEESKQELESKQHTLEKTHDAFTKMKFKMDRAFRELKDESDEVNRQLTGITSRKAKAKARAAAAPRAASQPPSDTFAPARPGKAAAGPASKAPVTDSGKPPAGMGKAGPARSGS